LSPLFSLVFKMVLMAPATVFRDFSPGIWTSFFYRDWLSAKEAPCRCDNSVLKWQDTLKIIKRQT
jgi:hypothetical protein